METPLLQTKLYIPPPRPEFVPRPRLIERLNEGLHRKLTLISAPAGFGKTTLVCDWINQKDEGGRPVLNEVKGPQDESGETLPPSAFIPHPSKVAWLSLDEADNDPARFFTYFIAALQQVNPQIGQTTLARLQSPQFPAGEALMTTLLNELADTATKIILVLDDYHLVETPTIHEAITFLLNRLPSQVHLVITTRADPPLPLSRLRGRGQLTELRESDLRFTAKEAAVFLNEVMRLNLPAADVAALEERTEGWITGLQLAGLSMREQADVGDFIDRFTGSHRYILDYLTDEVLDQQPEEVRRFLLQSSILNRLSGPLCNVVARQENSQAFLENLEAENLFIIPLDNERRWYRYHHLFADVLRSRLQQTMDAQELAVLHSRASAWYEQYAAAPDNQEFMVEAINHGLTGEDFERTARLIAQIAQIAIWQQGEINTVLKWLDKLPQQARMAWPQLTLTQALLLAWRQQFDAAEALLQDMIESPHTLSTLERDNFLGQAATIRATMANLQGNVQRAMGFAQEALEYLPEDDLQSRGISLGILGGIYRARGEVRAGIQAYAAASTRLQAAGQRVPALIALAYLGQIRALGGQLEQAYATYQQALQLAKAWGAQKFPAMGVVHINLGDLLRERNNLEAAGHHLQIGIELCGRWEGLGDDIFEGYLSLARLRQAQGDLAGALALIQTAIQVGQDHNVPDRAVFVGAQQARLWLAEGNVTAVKQWVEARGLHLDESPGNYPHEIEYLTLARLYLAEAKLDEAISLLQRLRHEVETAGRSGRLIEIMTLLALALYRQSDATQALLILSQVLTMAEPEGYVRVFVDEGFPMTALLKRMKAEERKPILSEADGMNDYIHKLLAAFADGDFYPSAFSPQPLIEPLTQREREVLRLIAVGRSNPEIAAELVIAMTTVKTHVKNIYGKLNVGNRFQAVARAKELSLL